MEKWTQNDITDQKGKTAIVTGSNTGIGFYTAKFLAEKGAHVIMACRSRKKAEAAKARIVNDVPNASLELMELDLSSQASVKKFAQKFSKKYSTLDLLINNAGVMMCPFSRTEDGFELQLATNHFGHFTLTGLLLPKLMKIENSRIVSVSSMAARFGKIAFDDPNYHNRPYDKMKAYGQTKLANLLFGRELNRRLEEAGKSTIALIAHPGWTSTDLQRHSPIAKFMNLFFAMPTWKGSLPTLRAATDPEAQGGKYYGPGGRMEMRGWPVLVNPEVGRNAEAVNWPDAKRLWEMSEELTQTRYEF